MLITDVSKNEQGQSLLEFLMMLPILFGFVFVLVRANTVIQMSIVDQQYARAQTLFLTFNNSVYPELRRQREFAKGQHNRMTLGVSDNAPGGNGDGTYNPLASTYSVTRKGTPAPGDDTPQTYPYALGESQQRGAVRVRNTTTLCTPSNFLKTGTTQQTPAAALADTGITGELSDSKAFAYCESNLKFEGEL